MACSRSGTVYATKFYREAFGLDVSHERVGPQGGIGWPMLVDHRRGVPLQAFDVVLHQVRHPLKVMQTLGIHWDQFWPKLEEAVGPLPGATLKRYMAYWCRYNEKAEALAMMTYRVEELHTGSETTRRIGDILGTIPKHSIVSRETNTRKNDRRVVTMDMLREADERLSSKVIEMASSYGYSMGDAG